MISPEETYYRKSYRMLERIIEAYKNGFNKNKTIKLWEEEYTKGYDNLHLMRTKQSCLTLTIAIALMGINKENLERIGKIVNYDNSLVYADIRNEMLTLEMKQRIEEFDNLKTQKCIFDNWLSLIMSPESDKNSIDILKRVRNGLLHSNFTIDNQNSNIMFTKIKTKSYYESTLLNANFEQFIIAYFSNHPSMGIPEKTYHFRINNNLKIFDRKSLKEYLEQLEIVIFSHKNQAFKGNNTLDYIIYENVVNSVIDLKKVIENAIKKGIVIENVQYVPINKEKIDDLINYFEEKFGEQFYQQSSDEIKAYLNAHLEYKLDPKRIISNWFLHFYFLIMQLSNHNFDVNTQFFKGDQYVFSSCYPSLLILKSYLIMYRIQNNTFTEIDYFKINFDFKDSEYQTYSYNIKDSEKKDDYYKESYIRIADKFPELKEELIKKKIICEIFRNSLAHGNVTIQLSDKQNPFIELQDIDQKTGKVRVLLLTINKFETLLNSKAFDPKYCTKKEMEEKILKK